MNAHASHFMKVGISYWTIFVDKIISNTLILGNDHSYGYGTEPNAGYIGVGETWAEAYGLDVGRYRFGSLYYYPLDIYWFKPKFYLRLHDYDGFTEQELFSCLTSDVNTIPKLRDKLISTFPTRTTQINNRYVESYP